jgi:hypothetical protein
MNDEIDEHFHDNLLSLADRCSCGRVLASSATFGCAHLGHMVVFQERTYVSSDRLMARVTERVPASSSIFNQDGP